MKPIIFNKSQATSLFRYPSFIKGMSRIMDLEGSLDEYKYQEDADTKSLEKDWVIVGNALHSSMKDYEQEENR